MPFGQQTPSTAGSVFVRAVAVVAITVVAMTVVIVVVFIVAIVVVFIVAIVVVVLLVFFAIDRTACTCLGRRRCCHCTRTVDIGASQRHGDVRQGTPDHTSTSNGDGSSGGITRENIPLEQRR